MSVCNYARPASSKVGKHAAMDSSSEGAALVFFRIGPSSTMGRALAFQILFCREVKAAVWLLLVRAARRWSGVRRWLLGALGGALWLVNPRNPGVILAAVLAAALLLRRSRMRTVRKDRKRWATAMKSAATYDEWARAAKMLDRAGGDGKDLFDEALVRAKRDDLRLRRLEGGVEDIVFCLRADLVRNLGNMCNPDLHKGRLRTPRVIEEYITEVRYHLRAVCETDCEDFSVAEKIAFIHETRHAFGRTALLLSGGAALGAFHLGVVRTLIEHRLLPRVVAGASVGSITCSFTATRTWPELQTFFGDPMPPMQFFDSMGSIMAMANRLFTKGAVHEIGSLQRKLRQLIGDLTFQEAYDLTGRVLGISVCSPRKHEPPRCLNYLTSPHVVIWSAVTASCAFPGLFEAQELMAKDREGRFVPYQSATFGRLGPEELNHMKRQWRDGSLESDLPMLQLKELFNVNHFIVSQANPHIAPLLRLKELTRVYGGNFAAKLAHIAEMEVKHRCNQALEMGFEMGGLAKLFQQEWEGDVTIVMPATFAQFAKIIQNPTPSELRKAILQGQRCTWEKLSAMQANCGIELMLDECVSELNRRQKAHRDAERYTQGSSAPAEPRRAKAASTTKRIPSWNCLVRESSWGSLDEAAEQDQAQAQAQAGGPWGGPSLRRLKPAHIEGSDSDSGTEAVDAANSSWTRVGGPLMKSASAVKFMLGMDTDGESADNPRTPTAQDSGDDAEGSSGRGGRARGTPPRAATAAAGGSRGKRANKIPSHDGFSPASSSDAKSEDNDSTEEREFSFSCPPPYSTASSSGVLLMGDRGLTPSGEGDEEEAMDLSDRGTAVRWGAAARGGSSGHGKEPVESQKGMGRGRKSWDLEALQVAPTGTENPEEGLSGEGESRAVDIAENPPSLEAELGARKSLERAGFGSSDSVLTLEDLPDDQSDSAEPDS